MLKSLLLIALSCTTVVTGSCDSVSTSSMTISTAASDDPTFWWRTTDGAVIGSHHSEQCSLIMFSGIQAVIATWDRSAARAIRLEDNSWHFANTSVPVVLAISGVQLSGTAIGTGTYLTMPLDRPIEPILAHANAVDANYRDATGVHQFSFAVDQAKMPALLKAVTRCRTSP